MIKKLSRLGNSSALVIDRTLMDLLEIDGDSPLKLTVEGKRLIVERADDEKADEKFEKVLKRTAKKNAELFRRLAK